MCIKLSGIVIRIVCFLPRCHSLARCWVVPRLVALSYWIRKPRRTMNCSFHYAGYSSRCHAHATWTYWPSVYSTPLVKSNPWKCKQFYRREYSNNICPSPTKRKPDCLKTMCLAFEPQCISTVLLFCNGLSTADCLSFLHECVWVVPLSLYSCVFSVYSLCILCMFFK